MRVLTVQQPAAGAILALGKTTENRSWGTPHRGPLAIHAAAATMPPGHPFWRFPAYRSALAAADAYARDQLDHHGVIIALAELVDVHPSNGSCCSPWGEHNHPWNVHWSLEQIRPLRTPIALRGSLGLRMLDERTALAVLREVDRG